MAFTNALFEAGKAIPIGDYRRMLDAELSLAEFAQRKINLSEIMSTARQILGKAASSAKESSAYLWDNLTASGDLMKIFEAFDDATRSSIVQSLGKIKNADDYQGFLTSLGDRLTKQRNLDPAKRDVAMRALSNLQAKRMPNFSLTNIFQKSDEASKTAFSNFLNWANDRKNTILSEISRRINKPINDISDLDALREMKIISDSDIDDIIKRTSSSAEEADTMRELFGIKALPPGPSVGTSTTSTTASASGFEPPKQSQPPKQPFSQSSKASTSRRTQQSSRRDDVVDAEGIGVQSSPIGAYSPPNPPTSGNWFGRLFDTPDKRIAAGGLALGAGLSVLGLSQLGYRRRQQMQDDQLKSKSVRRIY